ncbi:MAG: 23S rRNA (pseudouridine(1915)-N(3))-methyltransferase RlmH [Christensenellaceae bacterium]
MQKIRIIYVGKSKREEQPLESEYAKRIKRYADLELTELKDERASESLSAAEEIQVMKRGRSTAAIRPDERASPRNRRKAARHNCAEENPLGSP